MIFFDADYIFGFSHVLHVFYTIIPIHYIIFSFVLYSKGTLKIYIILSFLILQFSYLNSNPIISVNYIATLFQFTFFGVLRFYALFRYVVFCFVKLNYCTLRWTWMEKSIDLNVVVTSEEKYLYVFLYFII